MTSEANNKTGHSESSDLDGFLAWMDGSGFQLSPKLEIRPSGCLSNMGTFAREAISAGDLLFVIPRRFLLSAETSSISKLLGANAEALKTSSGWLPLILSIMFERLVDPSLWRPYLRVAPNFGEHRLPLQWTAEERCRLLQGTGINEEVERDLRKMETEWREVLLPFVRANASTFAAPEFQQLEFFKETVAFIIAYSFTEPSYDSDEEEEEKEGSEKSKAPFLVPMADMLNHSPANNAEVQYKIDRLEVRAILDIAAGAEVFNTYGELSNSELLRHHGFALPPSELRDSGVDTVPLPLRTAVSSARWDILSEAKFVSEEDDGEALFGPEGFVNSDFVGLVLSVGEMAEEELKARRCDPELPTEAAWLESLEEECEEVRDFLGCREQFSRLPAAWKRLLGRVAKRQLELLPPDCPEGSENDLPQRDLFANFVRRSHKQLLQLLLTSLAS